MEQGSYMFKNNVYVVKYLFPKLYNRFISVRTIKNPSTVSPTNRDARIKLTSLRRQIWTGVPSGAEGDTGRLVDAFVKTPLSWGVSRYAPMHYPTDEEVTLK